MKKIDATGRACPLPVIQAKRALETEKSLSIIVDNEIATQNLKNLPHKRMLHIVVSSKKPTDMKYFFQKKVR